MVGTRVLLGDLLWVDSGVGNGVCCLGFSLNGPAIMRELRCVVQFWVLSRDVGQRHHYLQRVAFELCARTVLHLESAELGIFLMTSAGDDLMIEAFAVQC